MSLDAENPAWHPEIKGIETLRFRIRALFEHTSDENGANRLQFACRNPFEDAKRLANATSKL
jgi:hypothetical protein